MMVRLVAALGATLLSMGGIADEHEIPPLPIEEIGRVATLPASYPDSWVMVDETSFSSMFGGKMIVLDVAEPRHGSRIKGMVDKSLIGNFTQSRTRPEFYIAESFHERGSRGPRHDWFVVYDKRTLSPIREIEWPTERLQALPGRYYMTVSGNEEFVFVANFTPAASFSVVGLDGHELLGEIATPGCVMTFPVGEQSVASLCSDGSMITSVVADDGSLVATERLGPFFDTDDTPIFERPAIVDGIAHFPGFLGEVHSIDFRGDVAEYLGSWSLVTAEEKAAGWRPGGLGFIDADERGQMYVVMHPDGFDGSQGHGGPQVWVFDPATRQLLRKIDAPNWAVSIAVTGGDEPYLVVTNAGMALDIIDADSGEHLRTISDFGSVTPLLVHKSY